ncbi:hypothetical protein LQV05_001253 [Cryptococcus neoformans]|nr:hypothetical protein J007_02082 [Cryptococcus neoformans var. grubii]OXC62431.1 hypothetical protein C358_02148 [Cryptococcus neoformans var. grubii MW-RSA852]UOH84452.1 hypothetical protein LQV05_001253 [Cryptococcus neoformans]
MSEQGSSKRTVLTTESMDEHGNKVKEYYLYPPNADKTSRTHPSSTCQWTFPDLHRVKGTTENMTVICGSSFDSRLPAASREICTCYKLLGYPPTSPLTSPSKNAAMDPHPRTSNSAKTEASTRRKWLSSDLCGQHRCVECRLTLDEVGVVVDDFKKGLEEWGVVFARKDKEDE